MNRAVMMAESREQAQDRLMLCMIELKHQPDFQDPDDADWCTNCDTGICRGCRYRCFYDNKEERYRHINPYAPACFLIPEGPMTTQPPILEDGPYMPDINEAIEGIRQTVSKKDEEIKQLQSKLDERMKDEGLVKFTVIIEGKYDTWLLQGSSRSYEIEQTPHVWRDPMTFPDFSKDTFTLFPSTNNISLKFEGVKLPYTVKSLKGK